MFFTAHFLRNLVKPKNNEIYLITFWEKYDIHANLQPVILILIYTFNCITRLFYIQHYTSDIKHVKSTFQPTSFHWIKIDRMKCHVECLYLYKIRFFITHIYHHIEIEKLKTFPQHSKPVIFRLPGVKNAK